ncbi:hypothetical protein [Phenylobacterium sp.]|uniref:hypothetical protein n=1 Tax=Phenylobacterium sp. TaxID=1871053 RepID=UPI0035657E2D
MRRLILAGLFAAALSGCATPTERPDRAMRWGVSANADEGAKLVLGVPDTDDVRMMLTCRPRSGQVNVTIVGRRGDPAAVELQSGKIVGRYAGAGHADEETLGAMDIAFSAPASDPLLTHLADTGDLTIVFPTRRIVLPNAFAEAHDFLRLCRAR